MHVNTHTPRQPVLEAAHPALPGSSEVHLWLCRQVPASGPGMLPSVLSRYLGRPVDALDFLRGPHGKPRLRPPCAGLEFNVSHSGRWQVLAVSGGAPVGVDIEPLDSARNVERIARRFYTSAEVETMDGLREDAARAYFFDCWVLKEALSKAAGGALAPTLGAVGFRPAVSAILYQDGEAPADGLPRCHELFEPAPGWPLALCREGVESPLPVRVFHWEGEGRHRPVDLPRRAGGTGFSRLP